MEDSLCLGINQLEIGKPILDATGSEPALLYSQNANWRAYTPAGSAGIPLLTQKPASRTFLRRSYGAIRLTEAADFCGNEYINPCAGASPSHWPLASCLIEYKDEARLGCAANAGHLTRAALKTAPT